MDKQRRFDVLAKALNLDDDSEMISVIIETIGNVTVEDIDNRDGEFEVFMKPTGITGRELEKLQEIFAIREIGVYGDPDIPDENVYLHMIVYVKE